MDDLTKALLDIGIRHVLRTPLSRELAKVGMQVVQRKLAQERGQTAQTDIAVRKADRTDLLPQLAAQGIPVIHGPAATQFWRGIRESPWANYLVFGRKGTGKTALSLLLAELTGRPLLAIGINQDLLDRLPYDAEEISPQHLLDDLPRRVTLLVDDAVLFFSNYTYSSPVASRIRELIALQRHFDHTFIFNSQNGSSLNRYVLEPSLCFLKPASLLYLDLERPNLRKRFGAAQQAFAAMDVDLWPRYAYVLGDAIEGLIEVELPTGWSSGLSRNKSYGHSIYHQPRGGLADE